jgi:hypothetical protein
VRRAVLTTAFLLHVAITGWVAVHHEAWTDETDSWLLVRDAPVSEVLRIASHRGAPLLFETLLWPFARGGAPYAAQQVINLLVVWAAVGLVVCADELPVVVRVLFALSYYPAFEYAVNARPYGLQMLLTFAMAAAWRSRQERPMRMAVILALLANTPVHGLVTATAAGIVLLLEQRRITKATLVALVGGLIAVGQLWPKGGPPRSANIPQLDTVTYAIGSAFFADARPEDAILPAVLILALIVFAIRKSWQALLFLGIAFTALMLINVFVWMGGLRHAGLLLIVALAAVWIGGTWPRPLTIALSVALAFSTVVAFGAWKLETKYAYSGSRELADFLRTTDAELVAYPLPFWASFLAYLPGRQIHGYGTYPHWTSEDSAWAKEPLAAYVERTRRELRGRRWVLILNDELPPEMERGFRLVYEPRTPVFRTYAERFRVYEPLVTPSGI